MLADGAKRPVRVRVCAPVRGGAMYVCCCCCVRAKNTENTPDIVHVHVRCWYHALFTEPHVYFSGVHLSDGFGEKNAGFVM